MASPLKASPAGGAASVPEALTESLVELSLGQSSAGAQLHVDVAGSLLRHAVLKGAFSFWSPSQPQVCVIFSFSKFWGYEGILFFFS